MRILCLCILTLLTVPAFAGKQLTPQEVPAHVSTARAQINWKAAGDEAVDVLRRYLMVPTINPPGDEQLGVAFLAAELDDAGIPWRTIPLGENRSSLIARVKGTSNAPPLCLLHHIDVVPAEADQWEHPPFGGVIQDGELWGRGALDMKGLGALQLMTLIWLQRNQIPLSRDVVLLAVADEEVGNAGARQLFEDDALWNSLHCAEVINEGGLGIQDALFEGQDVHGISVAEKGVLWVRIHATGPAGHGSVAQENEAPETLRHVMQAIDKGRLRPHFSPVVYDMLKGVGRHKRGAIGGVLRSKVLVNGLVKPKFMKRGPTRAMITNTAHLTGMHGGNKPNVVPSTAWVQYDCRLLPGVNGEDHLAQLKHWTRHIPNIAFEVLHNVPASESPVDDAVYRALTRYAVEGRPHAVAVPTLSVGFTDSLFARRRGARAYGYAPFVVTVEEAQTMHGHNERISVQNIHDGAKILFSTVVEVAGVPQ